MLQSIEAIIDQDGTLRFLEAVQLPRSRRAILTILDGAGIGSFAKSPVVPMLILALYLLPMTIWAVALWQK